ncbi:MAG: Dabb family protein [Limnohabitans sp.]|nr:Dabb family protein [Limnohabitans sp.]
MQTQVNSMCETRERPYVPMCWAPRWLLRGAACAALPMLASCTQDYSGNRGEVVTRTPFMRAPLQHVVLVDLADDAEIPAMRAASDRALPHIPQVKGYICGTPVDIGRANVSGDYDLGIIVQFESVDAYKAYLEHPLHQELVRAWRPKWKKSYIVDFAP